MSPPFFTSIQTEDKDLFCKLKNPCYRASINCWLRRNGERSAKWNAFSSFHANF